MTIPITFSKNPTTNITIKLLVMLVVAFASAALATVGLHQWLDSVYMRWTGTHNIPSDILTYTPKDILGLSVFLFFSPISFLLLVSVLSTAIRFLGYSSTRKNNAIVKSIGMSIIVIVSLFAAVIFTQRSYHFAYQVLQCGILGCINSTAHTWPATHGEYGDSQEGFKATLVIPMITVICGASITFFFVLLRDYANLLNATCCAKKSVKSNQVHLSDRLLRSTSSINEPLMDELNEELSHNDFYFKTNLQSSNSSTNTQSADINTPSIHTFTPYNTHFHQSMPLPSNLAPTTILSRPNSSPQSSQKSTTSAQSDIKRPSSCNSRILHLVCSFILLWAVFAAMFLVGSWAPNNFRNAWPSTIASAAKIHISTDPQQCIMKGEFNCPEVDAAYLQTQEYMINEYLILKFFPSNTIFYDTIFVIGLLGFLLPFIPFFNNRLQKKFKLPLYPICLLCTSRNTNKSTRHSRTVSKAYYTYWSGYDILLLIYTTLGLALFFFYWVANHNWKNRYPGSDLTSFWDNIMRAVGQAAIFIMSMLMFPVARNSVVLSVLGVSYESSLSYHKLFGTFFMIVALLHVVAALLTYMDNTDFWGALRDLIWPFPVRSFDNHDNFTIPIATITTFFALISIGILSVYEPFRRRFYDTFLMLHHITYITLIIAMLWHANASWIYLLPSLFVYLIDRFFRLYRQTKSVQLYPTTLSQAFVTFDPQDITTNSSGVMNLNNDVILGYRDSFGSNQSEITTTSTTFSTIYKHNANNIFFPQHNSHITESTPAPIYTITGTLSAKQSRSSKPHGIRLLDCRAAGKIIEITVDNSSGQFVHFPGQYFYMNIAEISLLESHPMTVASAAHYTTSDSLTFYIKCVDPEKNDSWTAKLYNYVYEYIIQARAKLAADGINSHNDILLDIPLTLSLDGPVGQEMNFTQLGSEGVEYEHIILIGGGIGITPLKAIYESLLLSFIYDYVPRLGANDEAENYKASISSTLNNASFRDFNTSRKTSSIMQYSREESRDSLNDSNFHIVADEETPTPPDNAKQSNESQSTIIPGAKLDNLKNIHLFFAAKDVALYSIMEDSLKVTPVGPFTAQLYCTNTSQQNLFNHQKAENANSGSRHKPSTGFGEDLFFLQTRSNDPLYQSISHLLQFSDNPNIPINSQVKSNLTESSYLETHVLNVLRQAYEEGKARINPQKVLLFVCGPELLQQQASAIAHKFGFHSHYETFDL